MTDLVVASIFRNSTGYLDRYFSQINELEICADCEVTLILAEGDSDDKTYKGLLERRRERDTVMYRPHGGKDYGSTDHPMRWNQIAYVCNAVMDRYVETAEGTRLVYVESDLIWEPDTIARLVNDLKSYPAVAPMSMKDGRFYDIWGHRGLDGERFTMDPPYHNDLETEDALVEISSAGSCVAMRPEIAKIARWGDNDGMVGLGRSIRFAAGGHLYLDRRVQVIHP